jgi:mono/diheme cytochrome c family protein
MSQRSIGPAARCSLMLAISTMVVVGGWELAVAAPPTTRQRTQVRSADNKVRKAGDLYRAKKFRLAGKLVEEVQQALEALAANNSDELAALTDPVEKRVVRARELLEQQGIEIAPMRGAKRSDAPGKDGVSFTRHVAPLLIVKCGGCHIQRSRGELSMATFASLEKGSAAGAVIMPGDSSGSRIIEMIASGDMPRGGAKIPPDELKLLVTWIDEGAKFDGDDPATPLAKTRPNEPDASTEKLPLLAAGDDDEVKFARDLGEVLIENCLECHGEQNPRGGFSVNTFDSVLQGGNRGAAIVSGRPEESLLVKKLRGKADGERMPMGRPPLPEKTIASIETWIALGARFDGADPAARLVDTVDLVTALLATHEELSARRAERAAKNWRLILPDAHGEPEQTANVLIYGNVGRELLAEVARAADEQSAKLARQFKLLPDQPLIKGRLTLYVFDKRYEYGEVGTMLERREIPAAWRGHWRYTGVDAYGCILLQDDAVSPGLVAQQIAGAYIASLGKVPRWFSEGTARAVAAKSDPKHPRVKTWDAEVLRIVQAADAPEDFLRGEFPPEDADLLSYGFVKYLMSPPKRHTALVVAIQGGAPFDEAFQEIYRGTPAEVAPEWAKRASRRR